MKAGETELEMATRHVAEQEARIAKQKALVARLHAKHLPTEDAREFLEEMITILAEMQKHRDELSN
jgi:hypothetical protein